MHVGGLDNTLPSFWTLVRWHGLRKYYHCGHLLVDAADGSSMSFIELLHVGAVDDILMSVSD